MSTSRFTTHVILAGSSTARAAEDNLSAERVPDAESGQIPVLCAFDHRRRPEARHAVHRLVEAGVGNRRDHGVPRCGYRLDHVEPHGLQP